VLSGAKRRAAPQSAKSIECYAVAGDIGLGRRYAAPRRDVVIPNALNNHARSIEPRSRVQVALNNAVRTGGQAKGVAGGTIGPPAVGSPGRPKKIHWDICNG